MPTNPLADVHSILVPIDGSECCYKALSVACDAAKRSRAALHLLYVIEVPRSVALDAPIEAELQRAEHALERGERIAEEHGVTVTGDLVQARQAGHAVVDEAIEQKVDVIVLGVPYSRPYGKFELSGLGRYVLEHAPSQVWLIRIAEPTAS